MPTRFSFKDFRHLKKPKNIIKQGKVINKLIMSAEKKKATNTSKLSQEIFQPANINNICNKRMKVLNSVYQNHVAEIMINGKSCIHLHNLGIEITKVRLDTNYKTLSVYWIAKNDPVEDCKVAEILNAVAGEIQHEINTLGLVGQSPHLKFVKDVFAMESLKVAEILDQIKLVDEIKNNDSNGIIKISGKSELPQMRNDVFALYHSDIMKRLLSKARTGIQAETPKFTEFIAKENSSDRGHFPFDRKSFSKYLMKNYILLRNIKKLENSSKVNFEDFSEDVDNEMPLEDLHD